MQSFAGRMASAPILAALLALAPMSSQAPVVRPQAPGRDNPTNHADAIVRGRVLAADNGQPLRRAQIRIVAPDVRENRVAMTDAQGSFEFRNLPAGRYTIEASKGGYVALSFGQPRPFEPGRPLALREGEVADRIDFRLPRASAITGRVLDEFGEPVLDAQVSVQRYQMQQGVRRLAATGRVVTTNDLGEFRVFGLSPGVYYLVANLRAPAETDAGDRSGYAPTYFPGTASVDAAQKLTLALGQTVTDLTLELVETRLARVSGTVVDSQGRPLAGAIRLLHRSGALVYTAGGQSGSDGSFAIGGIVPGQYTLVVQDPRTREFASQPLDVGGIDVAGLRLAAARPSRVTGRIVVSPDAKRPFERAGVFISASPMDPDPVGGLGPGTINDDLTFSVDARPGRMRVGLDAIARGGSVGWTQRAITLAGVDVLDSGIEIKPNEDVSGLEIDVTDKVSLVGGSVRDARGEPVQDYSVVVFPRDRELKTTSNRYFRLSRPDQSGHFKISSLPPGQYLIIALDAVDPADARDPDFLEPLRNRASSFSLGEGENKTLDLQLVPQP